MQNKHLFTLLVYFVINGALFSQKIVQASRESNFINYTTQDGLASNEIFKVYESSKGYLWICSRYGVSKFDGINFETFTEKDGLPSSAVMSACEDNNGVIWLGTNGGLAILVNNKIVSFDSSFNLPKKGIRSITKFKDGTLWLSSANCVTHINPNNLKSPIIKTYQPTQNEQRWVFRDVWQNNKGNIIAGCDSGAFYLRNDSLVRYNTLKTSAYQMVELPDGTEWYCAWMKPIRVFKNGKAAGIIDFGTGTLSMIKDSKGNIWIATWDKGVFKYEASQKKGEEKFINYSSKEGLSFNSFWGVNEDSGGNIWLSSWGAGLFKFSGETFTKISDKSGLPNNNITALIESPDGKIWISTDQSVSSYDKLTGKITNFTECNGKKLSLIHRLYANSANEIWCLGYIGKGYKIINNKIVEVEDLAGFGVTKDKEGNFLIATDDRGLMKISNDQKQFFDSKNVYGFSRVSGMYTDKKNNLWLFNSVKGMSLFKDNKFILLTKKDGFFDEFAWDIAQDDQGYYWIDVNGRGIYKCSLEPNHKFKIHDSITIKSDLGTETILTLKIANNVLYMGSSKGLLSYDINQKTQSKKTLKWYGKEDGLLNLDCVVHFVDSEGNVWLSTSNGAFCFNPKQVNANKQQTKTNITGIKLFFETPDWSKHSSGFTQTNLPENLILPYQKNHLTFSFIGINLFAPKKVLYQCMLAGLDETWSPASDRREATYSNIPPGTYTFMVKSCNNEGVWNDISSTYTFTIKPPFWKTIWFYVTCLISFILLLYFFIKYREKQLTKEKNVLENKVSERTHQLKEAFKEIEEKNKEITDSLNYASKIQSALLPSAKDIELLASDSFIFFKPKDIVSGDFYWATAVGSSELGVQSNSVVPTTNAEPRTPNSELFYLAVCDSTGHGVPGAFMSLLNISFLNEAFKEHNINKPNEIFNYIRARLTHSISKEGNKDGFDGVLICFDKRNNVLTYTAANNKPLLISNNTVVSLSYDKMPVGKGEKTDSFTLHQINYKKGDCLYLFTDGFADQFGGINGKKFKYKQLEKLLLSIHHLPFFKQKEIINSKFVEWQGALEQVDDVCLIGIKI